MSRNIGSVDRIIRVVVGVAILSLYFVGPKSPWALIGIIPVLTALIGWCPPYAMLGINTCKRKS